MYNQVGDIMGSAVGGAAGKSFQDEINKAEQVILSEFGNPTQSSSLTQLATSGFTVTAQLVESIRRLPSDERQMAIDRLAAEMAMQRTVSKALMVRNVLLTGLSIPQAAKATQVQAQVQEQINRLTRYIDDLVYEWRIRKEMTGETAMTLMRESLYQDSLGALQHKGQASDKQPLMGGAVQP
jgi:hypothetical protein